MGYEFNPWGLPYVISTTILIFITYVFYRTKRTPLNTLATAILIVVTLMVFGNLVLSMANDEVTFFVWLGISGFFGMLVPAMYLHIALFFGKKGRITDYPHHFLVYVPIALLFVLLFLRPEWVLSKILPGQSINGFFSFDMGPAMAAFYIYSNVGLGFSGLAILLWKYKHTTHPHLKESAKYLCIASLIPPIAILSDIVISFENLPIYFSPNYTLYSLVGGIVAYGTLRYGMLELESRIRRAVISFTTALFMMLLLTPLIIIFVMLSASLAVLVIICTFAMLAIALTHSALELAAMRLTEYLIPMLKWRDCKLEEIFLIHRGTGALITHSQVKDSNQGMDKDIIAGMLSAVQSFVRDSFNLEERETLRTLYMGNTKMMIEHAEHIYVAVIFTGYDSEDLRKDLQQTLYEIESAHKGAFANWTGRMDIFSSVEPVIDKFLASSRSSVT